MDMRRTVRVPWRVIWALVALTLVAFGILRLVHAGKAQRLIDDRFALEAQVLAAYAEEETLEERLAFTATDAFAEQEARRRFGYMSPGEIRFVVEKAPAQPDPVQEAPPWSAP
ncbi:MAG: septum formation initiator family protein [Oscillospiraceae bacterium]|nr:septum formation initiator family protein [Oscillospiraceae bacterium]